MWEESQRKQHLQQKQNNTERQLKHRYNLFLKKGKKCHISSPAVGDGQAKTPPGIIFNITALIC